MKPGLTKRTLEIDTLRGLACILLVMFHVVGNTSDSGLKVPNGHWLRDLSDALAYVRMPLFAMISGYVYAIRPFRGNFVGFAGGKARRLLLPMLSVGTVFAVVQARTPGSSSTVTNWWLLHINPVGHFWFLESMFLIFLLLMLLEHTHALSTVGRFACVWVLSVIVFKAFDATNMFGLYGATYLMPFFLVGLAFKRFQLKQSRLAWLAFGVFLLSCLFAVTLLATAYGKLVLSMLVGVSSGYALLCTGWQSRFLAYIGSQSFAIFLFHVFFTASTRILFSKMGVTNTYILLVLGCVVGVYGPVILEAKLQRFKAGVFLLGDTLKSVVSDAVVAKQS